MRTVSSILLLVFFVQSLPAQIYSRSGFPAPQESKDRYRRFPCGGNVLLDEDFTDGLPADWMVLDVDALEPREGIRFLTPNPGWQWVPDFKDNLNLNKVLASPSWYEDTVGTSDDYLVMPKMLLPDNTCLSWYAYSQDVEFGESYEIRVSTTTPDAAGFLANPAVYVVEDQGSDFTFETASLADYGGQEVYVAFRHTSTDKFILVIDDVRMAQVENRDIAMFELDPINASPNDSIFITGSVINRGLVPIVFDSMQMQISVAVNNTTLFSFGIADSFEFLPNDTIQFKATEPWVPTAEASVPLSVWVSGFGADDLAANDTISRFQPIGNTVSIDPDLISEGLSVFPNPVSSIMKLSLEQAERDLRIEVWDLKGRRHVQINQVSISSSGYELKIDALLPGLYLLKVQNRAGKYYLKKFLKQ